MDAKHLLNQEEKKQHIVGSFIEMHDLAAAANVIIDDTKLTDSQKHVVVQAIEERGKHYSKILILTFSLELSERPETFDAFVNDCLSELQKSSSHDKVICDIYRQIIAMVAGKSKDALRSFIGQLVAQ